MTLIWLMTFILVIITLMMVVTSTRLLARLGAPRSGYAHLRGVETPS